MWNGHGCLLMFNTDFTYLKSVEMAPELATAWGHDQALKWQHKALQHMAEALCWALDSAHHHARDAWVTRACCSLPTCITYLMFLYFMVAMEGRHQASAWAPTPSCLFSSVPHHCHLSRLLLSSQTSVSSCHVSVRNILYRITAASCYLYKPLVMLCQDKLK